MALIARVLGVSALTSVLVSGFGITVIRWYAPSHMSPDAYLLPGLVLGCVGGLIGAIAEAAREIVVAQERKSLRDGEWK